jgi:hypothetical protein
MPIDLTPKHLLRGKTIFLSASVPTPERDPARMKAYRKTEVSQQRVHSAVIAVARRVFYEGGHLVFGAHPSIAPLILLTLEHYQQPATAVPQGPQSPPSRETTAPRVTMYQSEVFKRANDASHDTDPATVWPLASQRLATLPGVSVVWTPVIDNESPVPTEKGKPPAPKSLTVMRQRMIGETHPDAMVVIGGMSGIHQELDVFRKLRPGRPVYVFETTGGAAHMLATADSDPNPDSSTFGVQQAASRDATVQVIDHDAAELVGRSVRRTQRSIDDLTFAANPEAGRLIAPIPPSAVDPLVDPTNGKPLYIPYELLVERIVTSLHS